MPHANFQPERSRPIHAAVPDIAADFYLLGIVDFDRILGLQRRLIYEAGETHRPRAVVLLCEHRDLISVGRDGSRAHIRLSNEQLQRTGVAVQWVGRGGGCVPHAPGQLAVYAIMPLSVVRWTVGEYLQRLQGGLQSAIESFNVHTSVREERFGIWGQSGLLATIGVAVRNWTTSYGAYVNVNPPMSLFHHVDTTAEGRGGTSMSCLLAERRVAAKMPSMRSAVVERLAAAFECCRFHVHAAHPLLPPSQEYAGESCASF